MLIDNNILKQIIVLLNTGNSVVRKIHLSHAFPIELYLSRKLESSK